MEGLWSVEFASNVGHSLNAGLGIVVFESQKILGGDAGRTYVGQYSVKHDKISASVRVSTFSKYAGVSVFDDMEDFDLIISGNIPEIFPINCKMKLEGHRKDAPDLKLFINFIKRAELP